VGGTPAFSTQPREQKELIEMTVFAAVHESGFGTKRTCRRSSVMSAFGGKADIWKCSGDVR